MRNQFSLLFMQNNKFYQFLISKIWILKIHSAKAWRREKAIEKNRYKKMILRGKGTHYNSFHINPEAIYHLFIYFTRLKAGIK